MAPEKFFDYLEGKLPPPEKERFEQALIANPDLQRQLVTVREIQRGMQRSASERIENAATARAGSRGRQLAVAFAVLVGLNVAIGLYFIFRQNVPSEQVRRAKEASFRHKLESSVEKSAAATFAPPTIGMERIPINAPREKQESIAAAVIEAAAKTGGSGTKALPNESGLSVLVLVPGAREQEFRNALTAFGAPSPAPTVAGPAGSPNDAVRLEVVLSVPR